MVGESIATTLNVTDLRLSPVIYVDQQPVTVIGIVSDTAGSSAALSSVVLPDAYARQRFGEPGELETMSIATRPGAADIVAEQAALAIDAVHVDAYRVLAPAPPTLIRDRISVATQGLFFALAGIAIVVSGVGIANVALIGVLARSSEIALRRAVGALPRHIAAQFLMESAVRGLVGGSLGTVVGVVTVALIAIGQRWTAVIEPWSWMLGPVLGCGIGMLAGLYPAWRASRVQPVAAFQL